MPPPPLPVLEPAPCHVLSNPRIYQTQLAVIQVVHCWVGGGGGGASVTTPCADLNQRETSPEIPRAARHHAVKGGQPGLWRRRLGPLLVVLKRAT